MAVCSKCGKKFSDDAHKCPSCGTSKYFNGALGYAGGKAAGGKGSSPKGGGSGIFAWFAGSFIATQVWPILKIFIPFVIGLIVWLVTRNFYFGAAGLCLTGIWFWNTSGGGRTVLIVFTVIFVAIGIPALNDVITTYTRMAGGGLSGGFKSFSSDIGCWVCQGSTGLNNPAACEKKCNTGMVSTTPLLDVSYDPPGTASPGRPISFNINMKLLAQDEDVKNLAVDLWVANESGCQFSYCIPEEMYVCPKVSKCLNIIEMGCGGAGSCNCQKNFCELNKGNPEITTNVLIYNPVCHGKKDVMLYPSMKTEYEYTTKGYYTAKVSQSETTSPTQDDSTPIGSVAATMKTDKDVYVLEKMSDTDYPTMTIRVANTGNGFAYIKSILIKQEHAANVGSFEITDCPGFTLSNNGNEIQLGLGVNQTTRVSPGDQWTSILCDIKVPTSGIEKFNEYKFTSYVTYRYMETQELSSVFLDCGQIQ
jgi:hypothetical protein